MSTPDSITWNRFVALGDSLTEGVGDPTRAGLRGWADLVAGALRTLNPGLEYHNLARRSLTTAQVRAEQLEPALAFDPDLVSVVVGMNDILSSSFSRDGYADGLRAVTEPFVRLGVTLMLGTFPPELPIFKVMRRSSATAIRTRLHAASDVVRDLAVEYEAVLADAPESWRYKMSECSIDGCHPNARGHAHIAQLFLDGLGTRAGFATPTIESGHWLTTSLGHLRWLATQGYLSGLRPRVRRLLSN